MPGRMIWRCFPKNDDPWERRDLSTALFGDRWVMFPRADYFRAYLQRPSTVAVDSLDAICDWLRACRYDETTYSGTDGWPPANDFETTRSGVCVDHALWGWRKLIELGVPALFVWGQFRQTEKANAWSSSHVWVQFHQEGVEYLFEPVQKDNNSMVGQMTELRGYYRPWYAIDPDFCRYEYYGFVHSVLYD